MEEQDKRLDDQSNGTHEPSNEAGALNQPNNEAATQVGQVLQGLARVTRQLPTVTTPPNRRIESRAAQLAARERIATLIMALGDPSNPQHQQAVDDLVALGEAAVPALNEALSPNRPWLTSYRAAEALGQIGDGRAAGPLLEALRHPNSNVRWSAVRALSVVGDARALLELRRVARDDRGKTSWGEPIAGAAQSALNQMQSQNMLLRGADLIKTAIACVLMLVALIIAWETVGNFRSALQQIGHEPVDASVIAPITASTVQPTANASGSPIQDQPQTNAAISPTTATTTTDQITGTVRATANVRAFPVQNQQNVIGGVTEGDDIIFLGRTPDGQWYHIRLGTRHAASSKINALDGSDSGWVHQTLLSTPGGDVPVEQIAVPTATPAIEEAAPTPTP